MNDEKVSQDPYAVVLADLRFKREEIDKLIRGLESIRGSSASVSTDDEPKTDRLPETDGVGAFLGMSIGEASKRVLASKRRTMNSAEIATAIQAGGLAMNSSDPANTVASVLARRQQVSGDIVKVSRGQFGLGEWYPGRSFKKKLGKSADAGGEQTMAEHLATLPKDDPAHDL